ncbi:BTB/POZ domain-containing protein KCTD5-like protein [Aphelenchoides avenae]|nr:BTB/POZ domain-containing protein KCTD5-like protein [Aphelenchus avenae]
MDRWIRLNVGGKIFTTTKQTLCKEPESFFARLFATDLQPSDKDESGAYLIDRDPDCFPAILSYLRSGLVNISDRSVIPALKKEADFYGLSVLMELLEAVSKKSISVETVSVVIDDDLPKIILPTTDENYDVFKQLKSPHHFPKLVSISGMYYTPTPYSRMTPFTTLVTHVEKVVTALGFQRKETGADAVHFVRYTEQ